MTSYGKTNYWDVKHGGTQAQDHEPYTGPDPTTILSDRQTQLQTNQEHK